MVSSRIVDRFFGVALIIAATGHLFGSFGHYAVDSTEPVWAISASVLAILLASINLLRVNRPADRTLAWICLGGRVAWIALALAFNASTGNIFDPRGLTHAIVTAVTGLLQPANRERYDRVGARTDVTLQIKPAPVRKSIHVSAAPERAFKVFTGDMTRWWRPDHHIGSAPLKEVVLEPRVGGRWREVTTDGAGCEWGKVLVWEPPHRVVLAWQLNSEWKYDPDFMTEVEVRFIADQAGTRVELEHRYIEKYGTRADAVRASLDSLEGWNGALVAFAALVDAG